MTSGGLDDADRETFDAIARDLQELRFRAGDVAYAEIVRRVGRLREARGVNPVQARPGRTTVYDAFRQGRSRLDIDLVCDIAEVLGAEGVELDRWRRRCQAARKRAIGTAPRAIPSDSVKPERSAQRHDTAPGGSPVPTRGSAELKVGLLILSLSINVLGAAAVAFMHLPLYLDMIGTGLMSLALGPWWGCLVAVSSGALALPFNGFSEIPMTLVACVGALSWGYGARRLRSAGGLTRFVALNALVALACTLVAVPLLLLFCGGATGHAGDVVAAGFFSMGEPDTLAVLQGNLLLSLMDKQLAGFVILMLLSALGRRRLLPRGSWVVELHVSLMTGRPTGVVSAT